ncbi:MAG: sodium-translocating pyrophosphatase [Candidatus Thermoplasmatota archaeon]|jgi:K(+)-stimulated pyrophosphate-energized sodium pump|nr:sodium-translocating pyrophosphatase [Candidatus Sysuiplasma jiujiangense]MBX8639930.1 sodium-translocating pyrophosphatase [Candidatus Sysuiplasma jiujiangense]MBX8641162.1 sodium-translocating pyrophosphatase [Candidatus Sysuiplasma jiujiangense]MCL4317723.1 sodium-translocating pyrophosphatase [Candidatus Thermoplasmatota archaeon]
MSDFIDFVIVAALIALIYAVVQTLTILRMDEGSEKMIDIARAIQAGSKAFLNRQYSTVAIFAIILTAIIAFVHQLGWKEAIGFAVGAASSAIAGYVGMNVSIRANVRTANAARKSLKDGLSVAFRGGSVTGITIVGFAVIGLSLLFLFYNGNPVDMLGYMFGASLVSLFARVGGGIYTKGADVGADLIGKVEVGIPEDDPRNPAVIADNVGDNVGDCAGMGADVFESYVVTIVATMVLGYTLVSVHTALGSNGVIYPLGIASVSIFASIIGVFFVRLGKSQKIMNALYKGIIATAVIAAVGFYFVASYLLPAKYVEPLFVDSIIGIIVVGLIMGITDYYTDTPFRPVRSIAKASTTGAGTNIITGLGWGLQSSFLQSLTIVGAVLISYTITGGGITNSISDFGLYGIGITAAAMLSLTGMIISVDAFGPITDNAGGIAEMAGLPEEVRERTDPLDAVGNTTKAVTKGYAVSSAALGALALFAAYYAYISGHGFTDLEINNPLVLSGLLIGATLPFFFTSFLMGAVGKAAQAIVVEVRNQFRNNPRILEGKDKPDYGKCVDVVTKEALRQLAVPAMIGILSPLIVGFVLGPLALGGLLIGVVLSGFGLAIMMTVGGAAWDNGKKLIEQGNYGGKGSDAHKAAVVGDTVGDATKDTAGPAINPLIKVVNTVSILFIAIILTFHLL